MDINLVNYDAIKFCTYTWNKGEKFSDLFGHREEKGIKLVIYNSLGEFLHLNSFSSPDM